MKTQHTPGPWEIDATDCPIIINGSNQDGPDCVCTIPISAPSFTYAYTAEVALSNAQLIAAAPELLDALKALARLPIETCPRCDGTGQREHGGINEACGQCGGTGKETGNPHPDEILQARAAIAKATSEPTE